MRNAELTDKARELARLLTYNEDRTQAAAKHMLLGMAHRLDALDVRARKTKFGLVIYNALGKSRKATIKELAAFYLFGVLPGAI